MKALLVFILLYGVSWNVFSQSDLLVLKQKNQVIQTWVPGSYIDFQFSSKQWIQGIIKNIRNDSILIDQVVLRQVPTQLGFLKTDTAHLGLMKLHVSEIYGMPKRQQGSGILSNGALFQLGAAAYIFLNIFNSLLKGDPVFGSRNLSSIAIAAGVWVTGKVLKSVHKTYIKTGGRYKLQMIHVS